MENNIRKLFNQFEFYDIYDACKNDKSTMENLISMQVSKGISEYEATENAEALISFVAGHESVRDMVSESAKATAECFLNESELSVEELHMLYFGLKLYHDDYLSGRMKDGADINELFDEYYAEYGNDPSVTEDYLKEQILDMLNDYCITPSTIKHISNGLKNSGDILVTSAALGEEGLRIKCIASMYLFLGDNGLTLVDAANIACTSVETQAIADALSTSQITHETAKKLLTGIIATMILGGLAVLIFKPLLAKVLVTGAATSLFKIGSASLLLGGWFSFLAFDDDFSNLIADTAASFKYHFIVNNDGVQAAKAMLGLAEIMAMAEEEEAVTIEYDDVDNEDNIFDTDENPQPLNALS